MIATYRVPKIQYDKDTAGPDLSGATFTVWVAKADSDTEYIIEAIGDPAQHAKIPVANQIRDPEEITLATIQVKEQQGGTR